MSQRGRVWLAIFIAAAIVRVLTLSAYPLHDTTEARYSEVARLMATSGDWVTPQIESGVPFWGKPPLSFWLTAASFDYLGLHEFAARLPSFLIMLLTAFLTFQFGRRAFSVDSGVGAAAILMTSAIGFVAAGAVMTDASLVLATTLSMVAFWKAVTEQERNWRYLFFVGLGLGMLAKGPISLVLVGLPVLAWLVRHRSFSASLRCLPWFSGTMIAVGIAAPWYLLAELKTPGFLEYFLVGEHWLRFVQSGWQGDLYGTAHSHPRGSIWLFALAAAFPWSLVALYAAAASWHGRASFRSVTPLQFYLLLWMLTPLLFFTFAGNILPSYVLPGLPALALLLGAWLTEQKSGAMHSGWILPVIMVAAGVTSTFDIVAGRSQKSLVNHQLSVTSPSPLFYFPKKPYSADFYSRGKAQLIESDDELMDFLSTPGTELIAIRRNRLAQLPPGIDACIRLEASFPTHLLFGKIGPGCRATVYFDRN